MRGFAIFLSTPARTAFTDSPSEVFLYMINNCTLLNLRTVN